MAEAKKARVGLLGLTLKLYDLYPDLKPRMVAFADRLVDTLSSFADVRFPGVCDTREQVDQAVAAFEAEDRDLIIVVLLTYAPSHIALPALLHTRMPFLVWNTQQLYAINQNTSAQETTENHGIHGVQDLCNVLVRSGRPLNIVTGHYQDGRTLSQIKGWCDAARTMHAMRRMRIGLLGYQMEGMGDFCVDETALLAQVGVGVHHIAMRAVADLARSAPQDEIDKQMAFDRQQFAFQTGIADAEHEASSRLEWAMRRVLVEQGLHGFAAHFTAVGEEGWLDTLPFLAASKLLGEGYGFGGEGDVTSAAAVALMIDLVGEADFCEMFSMDFAGNSILLMHMGEGNWHMARQSEPIHLVRSLLGLADLRVAPLLLAFSLEPGEATLVSLTTLSEGRLGLVVAEGRIADQPYIPDLGRPHGKFTPDIDLGDFLTRFSQAGGSHHQALAYGRWADTVSKLAALLDIKCARIG